MKKLWIIPAILLVTSACSVNNNRDLGQGQPQSQINQTGYSNVGQSPINQTRINYNMDRRGRDVGLGLNNINTTDQFGTEEIIPSEPDMGREDMVLKIVAESEKYTGKKMDEFAYVKQVFTKAGIDGLAINYSGTLDGEIPKDKMQPGDILYFDLNGDGKVDHHAIKLGNGDIIHVNRQGKVQVTDILKAPNWKQKIVRVQRVF